MADNAFASIEGSKAREPGRPTPRPRTSGRASQIFNSEELPVSLKSHVQRFLRVANQIAADSPRAAYLCRFNAFERAHNLDPHSRGRGVGQFKTVLYNYLEQNNEVTKRMRKGSSDAQELKYLYHKYDRIARNGATSSETSQQFFNAHMIFPTLLEVLKVLSGKDAEVPDEQTEENTGCFNILPLDLGSSQHAIMQLPEIKVSIAAIRYVHGLPLSKNHKEGTSFDLLDWLQDWFGFQKGNVANQREHLVLLFANLHVRQTPEPGSMPKLDDRAVTELLAKTFQNYNNWCRFLGRPSNIRLPSTKREEQQYQILYVALYFLIWGEASNLRLMPECLCYIFHHMAYDLSGVLFGSVSIKTGEKATPAYGGRPESFLEDVVTPLYKVIYEEALKNNGGTADHSRWRNYDDLNEYFWSTECFQIGWPMRCDHDFFCTTPKSQKVQNIKREHGTMIDGNRLHFKCKYSGYEDKESDILALKKHLADGNKVGYKDASVCPNEPTAVKISMTQHLQDVHKDTMVKKKAAKECPKSATRIDQDDEWNDKTVESLQAHEDEHQVKWLGKMNFIEKRSFMHLYRSFDRMWLFFISAFQVIIILAWHASESPLQLFNPAVFEDVISIFITWALFRVITVIIDIIFVWETRRTMSISQKGKFVVKLAVAIIWMITLPINYARSRQHSFCSSEQNLYQFGCKCMPEYIIAVMVYLASSSLEMALFFVPAVRNYIEMSDWTICSILSWWIEATTYVGRGMQENTIPLLKYSLFWILLLSCKLLFSFYFEVKPLVESTKQIMQISVSSYEWHELLPGVMNNVGAALAIWVPMTIVYFMDTQIWYSIFSAVFGGVYGIFCHLGEIRTMGMLRSRFMSFPKAFNAHFVPPSKKAEKRNIDLLQKKIFRMSEGERESYVKFAAVWNHIINSFRAEDLISNRERDLMIMPLSSDLGRGILRLPLFLLASKLSTALNMIQEFEGEYWQLDKMIRKDNCMYTAVEECLNLLRHVLDALVVGDREKRVVSATMSEIESNINNSTLLSNFKMSELPVLQDKLVHLVEILFKNEEAQYNTLVKLLQDIFEIVTTDMMIHGQKFTDSLKCSLEEDHCVPKKRKPPLFSSVDPKVLRFPLPHSVVPKEKVKRLFLLLTVKEAAMDIPTNLEARRRISFFATSLFMDMPTAPKVHEMLSFSVLTPYYAEEINFSEEELHSSPDGVSILSYMQKIHPDEWKNFLERMGYKTSDSLNYDHLPQKVNEEIRNWASFRGQTLNRTARGMMYYREAIKLQAFFDMAKDEDICETYEAIEKGNDRGKHPSHAKLDALVDMKFTYVITCQMYGAQKASGDRHARDILELMIRYPSLRIAYIEEKEEIKKDKPPQKVYSSVLVKAFNNLDQEIYRIKLPGPPIIGEGKPENQNQGIIYTRGDALQTIDMNQDNYMEEAFKMRNLLQEFLRHDQGRYPTILGLGEHIFTGSVSSLAWFMSYQESSFVTIGQRFLASPLRVRFHYGHPDIFDRIFHLTTGGVSKATKTINLSEDVFAGFNTTLRSGCVTYHEYMKVGKGRDVGVIQISKFEAKVANGNSEQTLSRDIFRLGRGFDFFRMLSCYFTTVGFYLSSLMSVLGVYTFLYGQLYLVLSGMEEAFIRRTPTHSMKSLETALSSQSFIQLGLLTGLPMIMELALEKGFRTALSDFILMQLQLASVFFTFSLGTKSHYYGRTLLHGGAKYRTTGRKFVVFHASFTENYRLYSRSHFVKGFELLFLLVVYNIYSRSYQRSMAYVTVTCSIWFMTISWLFAPFLFNPSGFFWQKITEDWSDWNKWITNHGGIGVQQDKSWESWWNDEQSHLRDSGLSSRILEILLSIRFFIYQYGLVYHLDIAQENKNIVVYVLSWFVIVAIFFLVKVVAAGRRHLSTSFHLMYRFFKALLFLAVVGVILVLFTICRLSIMDLIVCCLAFIPTGWGLLLIAQAISPKIENRPIWETVEALARAYDRGMGFLLFVPIAALAWMPVISAIQTRVLFNQAFTRQLQIQPILAAKGKRK